MKCSIASFFLLSSLLVNAAPLQKANYNHPLAARAAGDVVLGLDGGVEIEPTPSANALVDGQPTPTSVISSRTSFLSNRRYATRTSNPKFKEETESTASTSVFSTTSSLPTTAPSSTTTSSTRASSTTSSAPPAATSNSALHGPVSGSYYTDWNSDILPPASVDYSKFNLLYFAFALPDQNFNLYFTQSNSVSQLTDLVKRAHARGTSVVVSVGGWTGSKWFSPAVATESARQTFAQNIVNMVNDYDLDGIDLDWEYPGGSGAAGNIYTGSDSANLLLLLQLLRQKMGPNKLITMATTQSPFKGPNGSPMADISQHAKILDHVLLMNYDVWGASSNPGPNAPLSNACGNSMQPNANAQAGIDQWSKAGMPLSKIVLGLPAYGYVSSSSANKLVARSKNALDSDSEHVMQRMSRSEWMAEGIKQRQKRDMHQKRQMLPYGAMTVKDPETGAIITICPDNHGGQGCAANGATSTSSAKTATATGNPLPSGAIRLPSIKAAASGDLSAYIGQQVGFNSLVSLGALSSSYTAINGYTRMWDSCSSTPWLRNPVRNIIVTYDDPDSIKLKAQYAKSRGIGGVAFWDMKTDNNYDLMDAAREGFGF